MRLDFPNPAAVGEELEPGAGDMGHMGEGIGHLQQARVFQLSESDTACQLLGIAHFTSLLARSPLDRVNVRS